MRKVDKKAFINSNFDKEILFGDLISIALTNFNRKNIWTYESIKRGCRI